MRAMFVPFLLMLATPLWADPMIAARADGAILLMRHASAPGTGDPPGFRLDDCGTQRNLSDAGREEARAIGARFRDAGLSFTHILTSQWCRCRETADLMALGPVTDFPAVNSFFATRPEEPRQTAETLEWLAGLPEGARVLIVTHQVNITALTGLVPRSGEIVVTRRDGAGLAVTGRLPPP